MISCHVFSRSRGWSRNYGFLIYYPRVVGFLFIQNMSETTQSNFDLYTLKFSKTLFEQLFKKVKWRSHFKQM